MSTLPDVCVCVTLISRRRTWSWVSQWMVWRSRPLCGPPPGMFLLQPDWCCCWLAGWTSVALSLLEGLWTPYCCWPLNRCDQMTTESVIQMFVFTKERHRDTGGCSGSPGLSLGDSWLLDETSSRPLPGSLLTLSSTVSALSLTWRERGGYGERDRGRRERSTIFSGERTEQTTEVELFPLEGQIRRAGESVLAVTVTVLVIFFSDIFLK